MRLGIVVVALLLMAQAPLAHPETVQEKQLQQKNEELVGKLLTLREHHKDALPQVLDDRAMEPSHDRVARLKHANESLTQQLKEAHQQGYH